MNENGSTILILERMAEAKDRARQVAVKVNEQVSYALCGIEWEAGKADPENPPPIRMLDSGPSADCAESDQPGHGSICGRPGNKGMPES